MYISLYLPIVKSETKKNISIGQRRKKDEKWKHDQFCFIAYKMYIIYIILYWYYFSIKNNLL